METKIKLAELASKVLENTDFKLVDIDVIKLSGKNLLRFYFDSLNGITIDQCRVFSRMLEEEIEKDESNEQAPVPSPAV